MGVVASGKKKGATFTPVTQILNTVLRATLSVNICQHQSPLKSNLNSSPLCTPANFSASNTTEFSLFHLPNVEIFHSAALYFQTTVLTSKADVNKSLTLQWTNHKTNRSTRYRKEWQMSCLT